MWEIPMSGDARFSWEYDEGRARLLDLYQKGKDRQWDADKRIDWSIEVDPCNAFGVPDQASPLFGTVWWDKLGESGRKELRHHQASWQFSQFLHGEQGEAAPDLDAKFYSATQTMDEARHVETFKRFLLEKLDLVYPINDQLQKLLAETLTDSRWDMPYLGMQVLIEGLALAAFGVARDITTQPLPKQILTYVMQDEARHVAFGRMALRDYYKDLSAAELREREDFVIEGCHLMKDRIRQYEVWEHFGLPIPEIKQVLDGSKFMNMYQSFLFSRIVPCVKDIGLWGERVQRAYTDMGVIDMARQDLDALMRADEEQADRLDAERFAAEEEARRAEVDELIELERREEARS
ncbi:ferritin-like domain-containing protein [Actinocorallia longicatena]|uniref:Ferritin-like domain-containing protein n=1 Tax=Actinocorallia longicatena TaxID=111803 RepID=A0ABP6QKV7_9ACTN